MFGTLEPQHSRHGPQASPSLSSRRHPLPQSWHEPPRPGSHPARRRPRFGTAISEPLVRLQGRIFRASVRHPAFDVTDVRKVRPLAVRIPACPLGAPGFNYFTSAGEVTGPHSPLLWAVRISGCTSPPHLATGNGPIRPTFRARMVQGEEMLGPLPRPPPPRPSRRQPQTWT